MTLAKKIGFALLVTALLPICLAAVLKAEATAKAAESPPISADQMAAKDAAVTQCLMQQDVPVMGFGMKVVCIKKEHVSWVR